NISAPSVQGNADGNLTKDDADPSLDIDPSLLALLGEKAVPDEQSSRPVSLFDLLQVIQGEGASVDEDNPAVALFQKLFDRLAAGIPLEARGDDEIDSLVARLKKQVEFLKTGKVDDKEVPMP